MITITWFALVLIAGVCAIVWNLAKEGGPTSTFWFLLAFWFCCLAHLYPGVIALH